ncbi:MAG: hypothetical protein ACLP22_11280 [Solirubrobacteraceae bacterium]
MSRAEVLRRAAGEDPVVQKLDQLALQLEQIKAELDQLRRPTDIDDPSSPQNQICEPDHALACVVAGRPAAHPDRMMATEVVRG